MWWRSQTEVLRLLRCWSLACRGERHQVYSGAVSSGRGFSSLVQAPPVFDPVNGQEDEMASPGLEDQDAKKLGAYSSQWPTKSRTCVGTGLLLRETRTNNIATLDFVCCVFFCKVLLAAAKGSRKPQQTPQVGSTPGGRRLRRRPPAGCSQARVAGGGHGGAHQAWRVAISSRRHWPRWGRRFSWSLLDIRSWGIRIEILEMERLWSMFPEPSSTQIIHMARHLGFLFGWDPNPISTSTIGEFEVSAVME